MKHFIVPTLVRLAAGGGVAAMLALGAVSTATPVLAATTTAAKTPTAHPSAKPADNRQDRRQVARVIVEAEADVLGIKPEELRADLRAGKTVSQLAEARGLTKDQFADRLANQAKPGLDKLVDSKQITADQEAKVLARIRAGHIPFWDGRHHKQA
ncbi:MAG TPA: hypothetical protein VF134_05750 [Candidatus Dormibacteraeota bacterium]